MHVCTYTHTHTHRNWHRGTLWSFLQCSLVTVMSNSLQPHGLQHARLHCPSPTPGAYSNSSPSSRWCHPTSSSSFVLLLFSIFPNIRVFSNESVLCIRWSKYWSISFSISPSKWIFRIYKTRSFLIRMLILYSNGDPTIITSSKHKYLSKALSPHTISLGLRASRWVWGNTIQSFASTHYQAQLWIIEMCQWLKQIKNYAFRLLTIHEYMYVAGGQRAEIQIDVVNNLF